MQLLNFQLVGDRFAIVSIVASGTVYDLHNTAHLRSFQYHTLEGRVDLIWRVLIPGTDDLDQDKGSLIQLQFNNVEYFTVTARDPEMPIDEDSCLDQICLINESDDIQNLPQEGLEIHPLTDESTAHILFIMRGGQVIRIGAKSALFKHTV